MASAGTSSNDAVSLNIMPMLDIFSILVTFLLISFSTDPINHDLHEGVELPKSDTLTSLDEVPNIAATPTQLFLNDKVITQVVDGDIPEKDRAQGAIMPLFKELEKLRENADRMRKARGKKSKPGTLTLEMDKKLTFKLLKRIMQSAQQADFINFKLAVKKEMS